MSSTIDRTNAKRMALVYQGGALVALAGAVGIGILGVPGLATPAELTAVSERSTTPAAPALGPDSGVPGRSNEPYRHSMDPISVADRLALADNAPEPPEEDAQDDPEAQPEEARPEPVDTDSQSLIKRVRYLGYMSEGANPLAFIRLDESQVIVRQSQRVASTDESLSDVEVLEINTDNIKVRAAGDDGDGILVPLKAKVGPTIAVVQTEPIAAEPLDPSEITPAMIRAVELTPEEIESLSGLLPHQRALQERILKRQKLGLPAAFERNLPEEAREKARRADVFSRMRNNNRERAGQDDENTNEGADDRE